jgi:hypothetical protein
MPSIDVHTAFRLNLGPKGIVPFSVGRHEVDAEVAGHIYTLAHAKVIEAVAPKDPAPVQPPVVTVQDKPEDAPKAADETASPPAADERENLRARLDALGVAWDARWGAARLARTIEAAEAEKAASEAPKAGEGPSDQ